MAGGLAHGPRKGGGIRTAPVGGLWRELWWSRWQPGLYSPLWGQGGTATPNETATVPTPVELHVMPSASHEVQQGKGTGSQKHRRP